MNRSTKGHGLRLRRWSCLLILLGAAAYRAGAQEPIALPKHEAIVAPKMCLSELINMGLTRQPALVAARASLAAAESGQRGVSSLKFARLFTPDLPIRRQQSSLGVTIAAAGLEQAEWETRYAVVRNYYSVIYARQQLDVVLRVRGKLEGAVKTAKKLAAIGDPDIKVTQIDVDVLTLNLELLKSKEVEARVGIQKAFAALREALGVGLDCPLDIIDDTLPPLVTHLNKDELIAMALANRGELVQVTAAHEVTSLEVDAQNKIRGPVGKTFAFSSDIHAKPIPQGIANGEYRPGAIGLEMPGNLVGRKNERVQRAHDLNERAGAVLDKTQNLITLEVEATYLNWQGAAQKVQNLETAPKTARNITENIERQFDLGKVPGEGLLRAQTMEDQIAAGLNEALYQHALALAALERVTAGGYRIACKQP